MSQFRAHVPHVPTLPIEVASRMLASLSDVEYNVLVEVIARRPDPCMTALGVRQAVDQAATDVRAAIGRRLLPGELP